MPRNEQCSREREAARSSYNNRKENSETKKRSEEEAPVLEENSIHERENQIRVQEQEESDDDVEIVWEDEKSNGDTFGFKSGNILNLTCVTTFEDICAKSCDDHACDVCDDLCVACDDVDSSNLCDDKYVDCVDPCAYTCGDDDSDNIVNGEIIVDVEVNTQSLGNIWDLSAKCDDDLHANSSNNCESDSFETHDVNPSNCCENVSCGIHDNAFEDDSCDVNGVNSFNSNDNDGLELFTFDDNSLINEHVEKEETDGDLRDVFLSSEKEEEKESVTIEKENEEENFENMKVLFEEVHGKIIEEEKEKTRNESVRKEVDEKVVNEDYRGYHSHKDDNMELSRVQDTHRGILSRVN
nr:hypothetical protein Iba_chr04eCG17760 [Ipomoea batatas]